MTSLLPNLMLLAVVVPSGAHAWIKTEPSARFNAAMSAEGLFEVEQVK